MGASQAPDVDRPGSLGGGVTLLPNGWKVAPAGHHLPIGPLPLNMMLSPDGSYLVVTNNGYGKPALTVVDLKHWNIRTRLPLDNAWLGLAWHPDGKRIYSSAANQNAVVAVDYRDGALHQGAILQTSPPPTKDQPATE